MSSRANRKVIPITPVEDTSAVPLYEAHQKVYPRAVHGWFAKWRWVLVWATQIVFYGLPWLQWNGRQAVLFNLEARRFYLFDLVLWPQDFIYLTGLLVICALSLFLFTAIAGRLWCGYACPQTVYTEIFLWIEHRLEGDRAARMKLDAAPWSPRKIAIKLAKHAIWIGLGLWTGFTFVGYFTPIETLSGAVLDLSLGAWEIFWLLFYGFATWGNAGFMREQVCKYMCPYARFQGAMFDKDTLIITYDSARGEPRGSRPRKVVPREVGLGDCVDCTLCVQVCPTGIDIREGLQIECIACAACIDACDEVMDKMGYARGLIRYSTERALQGGASVVSIWKRLVRPRTLIYGTILLLLTIAVMGSLVFLRKPFKADVIRDRGTLARIVEGGQIENTYRIQIMNATELPQAYTLTVSGVPGLYIASDASAEVRAADSRAVAVRVRMPYGAAPAGSNRIVFHIESAGVQVNERSVFLVPR